jgi:diketogulonate reductase-like aldo/keto reductase
MKTSSGIEVPSMMYGTAWKKGETSRLTEMALESGFVAIDTANQLKHYDEALVGEAVQKAVNNGTPRESLFLQTKFTSIGGQDHRLPYEASANPATQVKQSMDSSLQHLHTDYVDSYVLHGPSSHLRLTDEDWEVWRAMEELYKAGKCKMIGASNVTAKQVEELCANASVKPMVVQNRCYAVHGWDREVRRICSANDIVYQGFSLLTANARELHSAAVRDIASRLGATIPQTVFCFAIKIGMVALTGTTNKQHMVEDLKSDAFELSDADVETLEKISG